MINCTLFIFDGKRTVQIETCFPTLPRRGDLIRFVDSDRGVDYRVRVCAVEFFDLDGEHDIHIRTENP